MLPVEERFMIKDLHRKGVSISAIARQTGRDRKTVRRAIQAPLDVRQTRKPRQRKIDPYVDYLQQRMSEGVYNARKLFMEIKGRGYSGGETQVRDYVQHRRPPRANAQATLRFETDPGQQGQVDWGHFGYVDLEGKRQPLYAFMMTLGWSRMMYLEFTTSLDTGWFLRGHLHAFEYFGGIPREILHDNLKSAVLKRDGDGTIHWNPRYLDFALVHGFRPRACQPYRAQTKGKVENGVGYVRINFWPGLHFSDLADLNQQALTWLNGIANPRIHGTTGEIPFQRWPREQLQPLPEVRYDTSVVVMRRVSKDCLVSYQGHQYSVPASYVRQTLMVKETEGREVLIVNGVGEIVAQHRLLSGRRQRSVDPAHYQTLYPAKTPAVPQRKYLPVIVDDAPVVEVRPLSLYAALVEGGCHE